MDLLQPVDALPSLSVTVMPVRVSLKRIRYTLAAPAHATANHGMHYFLSCIDKPTLPRRPPPPIFATSLLPASATATDTTVAEQ